MGKITKLVVLDGIGGATLGKDLSEAIQHKGYECQYRDLKSFKSISLYKIRSACYKALNKRENSDGFYHLPKLDKKAFELFISEVKPSHVIVVGFIYKYLSPDFMLDLKLKYSFELYLYDTDSCNLYSKRREFVFFLDKELTIYNRIFSFSKVTTNFFLNVKKFPASFLPFGAREFQLTRDVEPLNDVLFVGSSDLRRIFLLESIKEFVTVYGERWARNMPLISDGLKQRITDKPLWGEELEVALKASKIVLNITRSPFYGAGTGVNLRIFEGLAAGCFVLTDYCDELNDLFVIGEEVEVYTSADDLKQKINFYINNPEKRISIAKRGHERYLKCYKWDSIASQLLEKIFTH